MKAPVIIIAFIVAYGVVGFCPRTPGEWTAEKEGSGFHQVSRAGSGWDSGSSISMGSGAEGGEVGDAARFERENTGLVKGSS